MAVFVFVSTVLRSCLVEVHWEITHIWHTSFIVEIRWCTVVADLMYTRVYNYGRIGVPLLLLCCATVGRGNSGTAVVYLGYTTVALAQNHGSFRGFH